MNVPAFLSAFGLIFLAELGDKTQLTALALATRYPWRRVFVGVALAFAVLNAAAVTVGGALFAFVPLLWIQLGAAALFAAFGIASFRTPDETEESPAKGRAGRPVLTAFWMILVAELGDKTQLATAGLAAQAGAPLEVFAGSSLALWAVSLLGLLAGRHLAGRLPLRRLQQAGGCVFLLFAAASLWEALG
ncbi:MAG: TMEM165/GDT1 family protein [Deferrisomatales bacterium]